MTVIAWDGKTLAADKRADMGGHHNTTTKIHRVNDTLVAFCGTAAIGREMVEWVKRGADPGTFPAAQRDPDKCCGLLVIHADGALRKYEETPYPILFEQRQFAMGSGRDYARAAMHLGKTAAEAVAVACEFDPGCGNGVDTLDL